MSITRRKAISTGMYSAALLGSGLLAAKGLPSPPASPSMFDYIVEPGQTIQNVLNETVDGNVVGIKAGDYSTQNPTIQRNITFTSLRNQSNTADGESAAGEYPRIGNLTVDSSKEVLSSVVVSGIVMSSLTQNAVNYAMRSTLYEKCYVNNGITFQGNMINDFTKFLTCGLANYSGNILFNMLAQQTGSSGINQLFITGGTSLIVEPVAAVPSYIFYLGPMSEVYVNMNGGEIDIYGPASSGAVFHSANMYGLEAVIHGVRSEWEVPITGLFECLAEDNTATTQYNLTMNWDSILGGLTGTPTNPGTDNLLNITSARQATQISRFRVRGAEVAQYAQFRFGNLSVPLVTDIEITSPANYGVTPIPAPPIAADITNPYPFTVQIEPTGGTGLQIDDTLHQSRAYATTPTEIDLPSGWTLDWTGSLPTAMTWYRKV